MIVAFGIFEMAAGFTYVVYIPVALFLIGFFVVPLVIAGRMRVRVLDGKLIAGKDELPVTTITTIQPLDRDAAGCGSGRRLTQPRSSSYADGSGHR